MEIERLESSALGDLLELYQHLHDSDDPPPDDAVAHQTWEKIVSSPDMHCFGIRQQEQLVSTCFIALLPNLTRACRPYAVIENVVTHADHRGQGYARALLQYALQHAWQQDCYKVMQLTRQQYMSRSGQLKCARSRRGARPRVYSLGKRRYTELAHLGCP